jgi:putative ABC transport system permease protein
MTDIFRAKRQPNKVLNKLFFRSLKTSWVRSVVTVCAVILTTVLFTTLFTIGTNTVDTFQQATMRQSGGDGHAGLAFITNEVYDDVRDHPLIEKISYECILADSVDSRELAKRPGMLFYKDEVGIELSLLDLASGHWPREKNEIATDTETLRLLGVQPELGSSIDISFTAHGVSRSETFVLSGFWDAAPTDSSSLLLVSKAYVDSDPSIFVYSDEGLSAVGLVISNIMFANAFNLQSKLDTLIVESGYDPYDVDAQNYVQSTVRWTYLSANLEDSVPAVIALVVGLLLIVLTGYLIINNILQIAVINDIKFYGLLKTVGATSRQCKALVRRQTLLLAFVGILLGIIPGYYVGIVLVPVILGTTDIAGVSYTPSASPLIFAGSAIFALFTIVIGMRKAVNLASRISPIEASKISELSYRGKRGKKGKPKKTTDGGKVHKMAFTNFTRDKKRSMIVLLSLSLCLVLLNSIVTVSQSFDLNRYLSKFVDTDFLVAQTPYFSYGYLGSDQALDDESIAAIEHSPLYQEGGRIYSNEERPVTVDIQPVPQSKFASGPDLLPVAAVYGMDDFALSRLTVIEGKLDKALMSTGRYLIVGLMADDNGTPIDNSTLQIGQKVELHYFASNDPDSFVEDRSYEVLAKVTITPTNSSRLYFSDNCFYLPLEAYREVFPDPAVMSIIFNSSDVEEMETYLTEYTSAIKPNLDYESRQKYVDEFGQMKNLILAIGTVLCLVVGIIGLLNLVNTLTMGIVSRRYELALLRCVGMTTGQIMSMLCIEGLLYAFGTILVSSVTSVVVSVTVLQGVLGSLWFISYSFTVLPVLFAIPVLLFISVFAPSLIAVYVLRGNPCLKVREAY